MLREYKNQFHISISGLDLEYIWEDFSKESWGHQKKKKEVFKYLYSI